MIVYTARHVLPVAAPPLVDGAVAVDAGTIRSVGSRADVLSDAGTEAEVRDLGDVVLMPGLVNAHTHLDLSWMGEDRPPTGDYLTWLRGFVERRDREEESLARRAAEQAIEFMVSRGTAAVGDVTNRTWTPAMLARSPLWAVVFRELHDFRTSQAERLLEEAAAELDGMEADAAESAGRVRVALAPHAAHTTSVPLIKALAGRSKATQAPLSIHVAESNVEVGFLNDGLGPFRDFLQERERLDDTWTPPGQTPVDFLDRLHALSSRTLAVHCTQLGQRDLSRLQARGVVVVTCPRSNEALGVGKTPVAKLLGAGVPVALGTDSLASAPDLDLFAEMGVLLRQHPGLAPAAAIRLATLNGARALGLQDKLGTIQPDRAASLIAVPLPDPASDPLEAVVSEPESVLRLDEAAAPEGSE